MSDAIERISAYLSRREKARGIDKESIHGFDVGPDCGVELLASDLRTLLAEADALRRERDELKLRLTRAHDALEEIALAGMSGTGHESPEAMTDWHARRAREFIGIASRALWPELAPAAAPERAEPDHREDARGMVCATRGALLGGRAVCGDIHPGSNTCCSTDRCVHQRPRPCRCGPDGCADRVSCPRGER